MSKKITTPVNQIRLTNVAIVRLKRCGIRFEIATYPNKVSEWRKGDETDLDEVLQINRVFSNVSKGVVARTEDLKKAFGTGDEEKACIMILKKGELQVGSKERGHHAQQAARDIATIVAGKCVNSLTEKAVTVGMVERAMKDIHFSVKPNVSTKKQALKVIKLLDEDPTLPIRRGLMRLQVQGPKGAGRKLLATLEDSIDSFTMESQDYSDFYELVCTVDPGEYRAVDEIVSKCTRKKGRVDVLSVCVIDSQPSAPAAAAATGSVDSAAAATAAADESA
mmetsp:Transcript_1287/g.4616  ORF Transcript_1287/g.4616 Transcript_1287/m.4616 type:complete len:279 (-) Transcript_1287:23-859(-)|eukprot:CAMPEP_0114616606 /NCGR_PEP_ID=MMETSP0168-20121206/6772_1 /TAXON_ID=95228 ORGANISM="Vannella sp., Strain DIVA3 517/6/12" /NCGR_SAMPLE_ID=MMETSP0168 /ASSEMBLY_ACC=CAM_ASM_000044 /LENGTH=278 /DNA_ID=CAMNT_0001827723 /DNA_START=431 /DNA_END=1267 /DNA_ORIENTATION=+